MSYKNDDLNLPRKPNGARKQSTRWWQLKYFLFSPRKLGKMNPFWLIFFQMGWFNHPTRSTFATSCRWNCQVVGCQVPCLTSRFRREAAAKNEAEGMMETLRRTPTLLRNTAIENPVMFIFQPVTVRFTRGYIPCFLGFGYILPRNLPQKSPIFGMTKWIGDLQWAIQEGNEVNHLQGGSTYQL